MKSNRVQLVRGLLGKMSLKLKLLDLLASICGTLSESFAILMYLFTALAINDALRVEMSGLSSFTGQHWSLWAGLAIGFGVMKGPMRYLEQYLNHNLAFHMLAETRHHIYFALERLSPAKLEEKKSGDLLSLMTADIETLEIFYAHTISPVFIAFFTLVTFFLVCGLLGNFVFAGIYVLFYVLIGVVMPWLSFKYIGNRGQLYRKDYSSFASFLMENLSSTWAITIAQKEKEKLQEVQSRSEEINKVSRELRWRSYVMTRSNQFILGIASLVFAILSIHHLISFPDSYLIPLMGLLVLPGAFRPALALGALPGNLANTFASTERYLNLLDEKPLVEEQTKGKELQKIDSINFDQVSFTYPGEERAILDDVTLDLKAEGIIGIKGKSGSGKSTILKLLLRHRDVNEGKLLYDQTNIKDINSISLRKEISMMDQSTILFQETLRENMKEGKEDATDEEIIKAMEQAKISSLLTSLPKGLDTYLDSEKLTISTGEKQRLGLARILLRNPQIILLDEPTSNVDNTTEQELLKTFKELSKSKTLILVSHRPMTLTIADKVYDLKNGRLVSQ